MQPCQPILSLAGPRSGTHGGARVERGYRPNPRNQRPPHTPTRLPQPSAIPPLTPSPPSVTVEHMYDTPPQATTEDQPPSLAEIIREETDDGRILVRVLSDIALGKIEDTKPHHRIAAIKELYRQRRDHTPDHSCGCDDKNGAQSAANTTGEEITKPPDDTAGPDQPSEIAHAAESEVPRPTENTDPTVENTDSADPEPEQPLDETDHAEIEPDQTLENPDPAEPPSRRSHLTRRERRRLNRNSAAPPRPSGNGPGNSQLAVDSVVSAGFR